VLMLCSLVELDVDISVIITLAYQGNNVRSPVISLSILKSSSRLENVRSFLKSLNVSQSSESST